MGGRRTEQPRVSGSRMQSATAAGCRPSTLGMPQISSRPGSGRIGPVPVQSGQEIDALRGVRSVIMERPWASLIARLLAETQRAGVFQAYRSYDDDERNAP